MSPTAVSTRGRPGPPLNGPRATANGGYACGVVARHVDGPAHVSLRRPVPLGTPLELERHDDGHVTLHDGEILIAEGDPALPLDLEPPYRPTVEEARAATARAPGRLARTCSAPAGSACRPPRHDGLGVGSSARWLAHPGAGGEAAAVLDAGAGGARGRLGGTQLPELHAAAVGRHTTPSLLAAMHAELLEPMPAGEPVALVGWTLGLRGAQAPQRDGDHRRRRPRAGPGVGALWIRVRD